MASTGQQHPEQTCGDNITDDETNLDILPVAQGSDNSSNPQTDQPGNEREEARELPTSSTDNRSPSDDSGEMADNSSTPANNDSSSTHSGNTEGCPGILVGQDNTHSAGGAEKSANTEVTGENSRDGQHEEREMFGAGSSTQGWFLNYWLFE